jgi:hypothetical protein
MSGGRVFPAVRELYFYCEHPHRSDSVKDVPDGTRIVREIVMVDGVAEERVEGTLGI